MEKRTFETDGKEVTVFLAEEADRPLIVLNNFSGDGSSVRKELEHMNCPDFNMVSVGNLKWDDEMTPWYCPPLSPADPPCTGGADRYLSVLLDRILPEAEHCIEGTPGFTGIAGYSLAGLFALYALYQSDRFTKAASMSGSLWFPDFPEYVMSHDLKARPDRVYLSLGDKEAKTRNKYLKNVRKNTEAIADYYEHAGLSVRYELNPGNHFYDAECRSAKGILDLLIN